MVTDFFNKFSSKLQQTAAMKISDHRIGMSFAVGTFFALLPISVFAVGICVTLIFFFRKLHKLSLFLSLVFWNPLWNVLFFAPAVTIGQFLLGDAKLFDTIPYLGKILSVSQDYMVGISVIAIYMSLLSYFAIRLVVKLHRIRRLEKELTMPPQERLKRRM
ncbi:MAG TPA: DUF2062 domain-containing protein [Acidobacteriota bacterium]|nr:DUF2062 domain-containing protein [Acidobacteriota bacterium]